MDQELNQRVIQELGALKLQVIELQVRLKFAIQEVEMLRESQRNDGEAAEAPVQEPTG